MEILKMKKYKLFLLSIFIVFFGLSAANDSFSRFDYPGTELQKLALQVRDKLSYRYGSAELPDWAQMDPEKDGYEGTRTLKFYEMINKTEAKPKTVIVAVIDSGFDIDHPDLKDNIWNNEAEINGQPGVDDDNNGYIDDFHGWSFLGKVRNLNLEAARELIRLRKEGVSPNDAYFKKVYNKVDEDKQETKGTLSAIKQFLSEIEDAEKTLKKKNYPTDAAKLKEILPLLSGDFKDAANTIIMTTSLIGMNKDDLVKAKKEYEAKDKILYDTTMNATQLIGDNPEILLEKGYGSNDIVYLEGEHGTHVAGIIAANKKGIGQAPFAKIMCLRAVPEEGDERDKDIGNAIRYAVDNGADVINMSAGKYFSPNPEFVADAIKYADEKGVLFVVSAGNESEDIETTINFPRKFYIENGEMKFFSNMIVVGASSWMKTWNAAKDPDNQNEGFDLSASFSNYSGKVVDLFAPGVKINSTVPGGKYEKISGTSMASPVVSGVAAVIKGYFPYMKAAGIKELLMKSSRKYEGLKVKVRDKAGNILFSSLSKSGGVVDLFSAYQFALEMK